MGKFTKKEKEMIDYGLVLADIEHGKDGKILKLRKKVGKLM